MKSISSLVLTLTLVSNSFVGPLQAFVIKDEGGGINEGRIEEGDDQRVVHYKMSLVGKTFKTKKRGRQFPFKSKYYFLISKNGREFAYPLEMSNSSLERKIRETVGSTILIEANLIREHIVIDNKVIEILVLNPYKVVPLKEQENNLRLAELGLTPQQISKIQKMESHIISAYSFDEKRPQWSIPVSDRDAEGFLMVAGAMLLAGIFLGKRNLTGPVSPFGVPRLGP